MKTQSVLMVCLGNICRSPMAEGALRAAAGKAGLSLTVDSAGTGGWHKGEAPDPRAQAAALRGGVDISGQRARQVRPADFDDFDLILAMDRDNLADLAALMPKGARAQLSLLMDHVPGRAGKSVADPYYGDAKGFDRTWAEVTAGAAGVLALISGKP